MRPGRRLHLAGLALVLAGAAMVALTAAPEAARAEVEWLCHPGEEPNPCRSSLQTTVRERDGGSRVEDPGLPADPPIDCFYVYPTVSNQPTPNATKSKDPEVRGIAASLTRAE